MGLLYNDWCENRNSRKTREANGGGYEEGKEDTVLLAWLSASTAKSNEMVQKADIMNQVQAQYDSLYAARDNVYNDGLPQRAARRVPQYLATGTVLDVGAGEGQTACWLAQQGFNVTALDFSAVGLKKLKARVDQTGLAVETVLADIETFAYQNSYDAVLFLFVLHHLNTDVAVKVLQTAQAHTKPGGIHIIAAFSNKGGLFERAKQSGRFYPAAQDLEGLYQAWQIQEVSQFDRESIAKDKSGSPLVNEVLLFVAQKPAS